MTLEKRIAEYRKAADGFSDGEECDRVLYEHTVFGLAIIDELLAERDRLRQELTYHH